MPKRKYSDSLYGLPRYIANNPERVIKLARQAYNYGRRYLSAKPSKQNVREKTHRALFFPSQMYARPGRYKRGRQRKYRRKRYRFNAKPALGPVLSDRTTGAGVMTTSINQCSYSNFTIGRASDYHDLLANFVQIGETDANAEREETVDLRSWNQQRLLLVGTVSVMKLRNNSTYPTDIYFYECTAKHYTSVTAEGAIDDGLDDLAGADAGWETEPMFYPTMSKPFNKRYRVLNKRKVRLNPGDETTYIVRTARNKVFDEDYYDTRNSNPIWPNLTKVLLIRLQGCIAHDETTSSLVGYASAQIDYVQETTHKYRFIQAPQVRRDTYNDGLDAVVTENIAQPDVTSDEKIDV